MKVSWLSLLAVCALTLSVAHAKESEADIVAKLIREVERYQKPPCQFEPVDVSVIRKRREWLMRTLDRLDEYIVENPSEPEVKAWREQLRLAELRRQLLQPCPDAIWLKQYLNDEVCKKMQEAVADLEPHKDLFDVKYTGYHIVASLFRALTRYAEILDDHEHQTAAQDRLNCRLGKLHSLLEDYLKAGDDSKRSKILSTIHDINEELVVSLQVSNLTECLRSHYLQPKASVFVSSRVLTRVASLLKVPPQTISRSEGGTRLQGVAIPIGVVEFEGGHNDRMGVLQGRYVGPVVFEGCAERKHIRLGISARLDARVSKNLFVLQGAPDSEESRSRVRLLSASSSRGNLVDAVVDRAARRSFDAKQIEAEIGDDVDDLVTQVANYINLGVVQELTEKLKKRDCEEMREIVHVRGYRSESHGIEVVLSNSRQGFQSPDDAPRSFVHGGDQGTDFAVTLRRGLSRELVGSLLPREPLNITPEFLNGVLSFLNVESESPGPELKVWFPTDREFVELVDQKIKVELIVADAGAPKEGYPATFELAHRLVGQGLEIDLDIKVPAKPELAEQLRSRLDCFCHLNRIRLPQFPRASGDPVSVGDVVNLKLDVAKHYVTVFGELAGK